MRFILFIVLTSAIQQGRGEEISFEVYEKKDDKYQLVHKSTKSYSLDDIEVRDSLDFDRNLFWKKRLVLWNDFGLNASIHQDEELTGFGLSIDKDYGGFSWEWFSNDCGCKKSESDKVKEKYVFEKLQESGKIKIKVNRYDNWEEIISYEFLEDVSMRGDLGFFGSLGGETHRILIKKGSVFTVGKELKKSN